MTQPLDTQGCLELVQTTLDNLKAKNITVINVTSMTELMDYMIIAEGTSKRHVKAMADNVAMEVKQAGLMPLGREGGRDSDWTLVDIDSVLVHIMTPAAREHYDIESLWASPEELAKFAVKREDYRR